MKKTLRMVALLLVFSLLGLFCACKPKDNASPEAVVQAFFDSMEERDSDRYLKCFVPPMREYIIELSGGKDEVFGSMEALLPEGAAYTCEILGTEDAADQVNTIRETLLEQNMPVEIEAASSVLISLSVSMESVASASEARDYTATCIQVDGQWYYFSLT